MDKHGKMDEAELRAAYQLQSLKISVLTETVFLARVGGDAALAGRVAVGGVLALDQAEQWWRKREQFRLKEWLPELLELYESKREVATHHSVDNSVTLRIPSTHF